MQGPSPQEMVPIVVPIFGMITGIVITGFVVIGPVGRAIGKVIMHLFGVDRGATLLGRRGGRRARAPRGAGQPPGVAAAGDRGAGRASGLRRAAAGQGAREGPAAGGRAVTQVVNLPNPNEIVGAIMPLAGMAMVVITTGFVVLGPVGRAIGRVIMYRLGGERERAVPAADISELRSPARGAGRAAGRWCSGRCRTWRNGRTSPSGCWRRRRSQGRLPGAKDAAG